ncbi:transposase family protein [Streptomyces sp. NPDC050388]|uniref:transposase family protein n=1 Tax=Streptomyces sp. NPDC050388 TaxID=3155781 RepID=UPI003444BE00
MSSSLIRVLQRHCGGIDPCRPPEELTSLRVMLDQLPDPRRVRGRRYRLSSLITLCLLVVLGGATTLASIARFATDAPTEVCTGIGLGASHAAPPWAACCPASTVTPSTTPYPPFAPLLDRLDLHATSLPPTRCTTQTDHAEQIIAWDTHCMLVVKGNQKKLRRQLRRLPRREVPL